MAGGTPRSDARTPLILRPLSRLHRECSQVSSGGRRGQSVRSLQAAIAGDGIDLPQDADGVDSAAAGRAISAVVRIVRRRDRRRWSAWLSGNHSPDTPSGTTPPDTSEIAPGGWRISVAPGDCVLHFRVTPGTGAAAALTPAGRNGLRYPRSHPRKTRNPPRPANLAFGQAEGFERWGSCNVF